MNDKIPPMAPPANDPIPVAVVETSRPAPLNLMGLGTDRCAACDAYHPVIQTGGNVGQCRRRSPQLFLAGLKPQPDNSLAAFVDTAWPKVLANWVCCEFKRKGVNGSVKLPVVGAAEALTPPVGQKTE